MERSLHSNNQEANQPESQWDPHTWHDRWRNYQRSKHQISQSIGIRPS